MAQKRSALVYFVPLAAIVAIGGCRDRRHTNGPDRSHARAEHRDHHRDRDDERWTGVYIDPAIAHACGIPQPHTTFAFDSAAVPPTARKTIDRLGRCLDRGALAGENVVLVGYTDPRGPNRYNKKLGKSRAESVAAELREAGVRHERIETESRGERGAAKDPDGWPADRRVEIRLEDD